MHPILAAFGTEREAEALGTGQMDAPWFTVAAIGSRTHTLD
jgi:hypothetical protein